MVITSSQDHVTRKPHVSDGRMHTTLYAVCRPVRQAPWMLDFRNRGCARSLRIPTPATW
ncbi:unnamed protein product [Ectocarpus sp. 8 AP-2014]